MSPEDGYFRRQRVKRNVIRIALIGWLAVGFFLAVGYLIAQFTS